MKRTMNKTLFVCFCLAAAGRARGNPGVAQPPAVEPARQAVIESRMPDWSKVKARANRLGANFLQGINGKSQYNYTRLKLRVDDAWQVSAAREREEQNRQIHSLARLAGDLAAAKVTPREKAVCAAAVSQLFQLRMLYLYGTLYPKLLDESVRQGGQPAGRQMAGPEWQLEVSAPEAQALTGKYKALCGVEPDLFVED